MHVEECCQALLCQLMPTIDRRREGAAIDIGVGTFSFYCEMFAKLGYRSVAVEPMPTDKLARICKINSIQLVESCVSHIEGTVPLYIGTFEGQENLNLNSMNPDWWGVDKSEARCVQSTRVSELLSQLDIEQITCMKIDVEGLEYSIINQFHTLEEVLLPKILMFEYGGGGKKKSHQAGWAPENLKGTLEALTYIQSLGYRQLIIIDSADGSTAKMIDLSTTKVSPELFPADSIYGNIIAFRGYKYSMNQVLSICGPYKKNQSPPPMLKIPERLSSKLARKFRQLSVK